MSDISQPTGSALVKPRDEGRSQGHARGDRPPPKKVADAYKETIKAKPADDRVTILGIPAEQITPATQAALASLVAEINFLRASVRRLEAGTVVAKRDVLPAEGELLPADIVLAQLGRGAATPLPEGVARVLVLAYLSTYEDVRRSSGLLAANTLLADVAQRMTQAEFSASIALQTDAGKPITHAPGMFRFRAVGFAGGSTLVALAELPAFGLDETYVSRQVRDHCLAGGFNVGGIEMAAALSVAAVVMSSNEGALTAMARADHMLRGSSI